LTDHVKVNTLENSKALERYDVGYVVRNGRPRRPWRMIPAVTPRKASPTRASCVKKKKKGVAVLDQDIIIRCDF
jgi:hypothetical protein